MPEKLFVSRYEAAEMLGVSLPTIARWTASGTVPFKKLGKRVLIPIAWIEAQAALPTDSAEATISESNNPAISAPEEAQRRDQMPVTYFPKTGLIQFRAPLSLVGQLEALAEALGVSRPDLLRYLVDLGLGLAQDKAKDMTALRGEIWRHQVERSYLEAQSMALEAGVIGPEGAP